ncbi:MAG: sodium:proton antiporter [Candidatus Riflebacteria bacterium HGW-Riflebacteria-1]|jgi:Na+/H+ antiporter NhaD/arsenite permease-like protein|nr:MAG: sodium:proton antiporter [Candidatus Riflebacteria bacterium HGW-Riflebacteria-1]
MSLLTVVPFIAWLLTIALAPLLFEHFWEKNSNKAVLSFLFASPVLAYLLTHNMSHELWLSTEEYFSFIVLLASLFIVSGGILVEGDIEATPRNNIFLFIIGAILANFIGTTGASMVLIRPLLKINSQRTRMSHVPIFFIFIVSNIGGCLTPLGDPPVFLGFLKGVPFFWTLSLFPMWLLNMTFILTIFYLIDSYNYNREPATALNRDAAEIRPIKVSGKRNTWFLVGIIAAVFLPAPAREVMMIAMSMMSLRVTPTRCREQNSFSFTPINEVAILFAGIFVTMVPALLLLKERGAELGLTQPWQFFWVTGGLSSFLDNAPTYLTDLSLAQSMAAHDSSLAKEVVGIPAVYLRAISAGAVFMGANTYIGNGPNFMVKTISESSGVKMPSFFGYFAYACAILIPVFLIDTWLFF